MKKKWSEWLWEGWCIASIIGIWPRHIEPNLLAVKRLALPIRELPKELDGLKIAHFSDLHWNRSFSKTLTKKISAQINNWKPDFIFFTGDWICKALVEDAQGLKQFLQRLHAPNGCYSILGNHDYNQFVTVSKEGLYDIEASHASSAIQKGFSRLFHPVKAKGQHSSRVRSVQLNEELLTLLEETPFKNLTNETVVVPYKSSFINITGLEEYVTGRFNPEQAFVHYNQQFPGIVLCHNPDAIPLLDSYPGALVLSGHTHGGQVDLPGIWRRFTPMEHPELKEGLLQRTNKWVYINRGIGSVMKFRWFAKPELTLITLRQD